MQRLYPAIGGDRQNFDDKNDDDNISRASKIISTVIKVPSALNGRQSMQHIGNGGRDLRKQSSSLPDATNSSKSPIAGTDTSTTNNANVFNSEPIADLFRETTVMVRIY